LPVLSKYGIYASCHMLPQGKEMHALPIKKWHLSKHVQTTEILEAVWTVSWSPN